VAAFVRNGWPDSIGISGRNHSEYALQVFQSQQLPDSLADGHRLLPEFYALPFQSRAEYGRAYDRSTSSLKRRCRIRIEPEKSIDFSALILILSVSAVIAYGYFNRVDMPIFESRLELHNQIIAGTAPSPYRYRILVPFIGEVLTQGLSVVLSVKAAFLLAYAIYDLLSIFFLMVVLFFWLKTWFTRDQALIGVLFVAGTIPI